MRYRVAGQCQYTFVGLSNHTYSPGDCFEIVNGSFRTTQIRVYNIEC